MNAFARIPIPSQRMVSGIQEIGGIGRRISNNGVMNLLNPVYQPISSPTGTPVTIARRNPVSETCKDARRLLGIVAPSGLPLVSL